MIRSPLNRSKSVDHTAGDKGKASMQSSFFERASFFSIARDASFNSSENQKALKIAFYNTAAFVFVGVLFYTCIQVFYILEFCITPLLWALLLGAVLYPVKQKGKALILEGLEHQMDSGMPMVVGLAVLPFALLQKILAWVISVTMRTYTELIIAFILLMLCIVTDLIDLFDLSSDLMNIGGDMSSSCLEFLESYNLIVWTIAIGYLIMIALWWTPVTSPYLEWMSLPVWVLCVATIISYFGPWRNLIAVGVFLILGCGTYAAFMDYSNKRRGVQLNTSGENMDTSAGTLNLGPKVEQPTTSTPATSRKLPPISPGILSSPKPAPGSVTDKYFSVLGWCVVLIILGRDVGLVMRVAVMVLLLVFVKVVCSKLYVRSTAHKVWHRVEALIVSSSGSRLRALCPPSVRGLGLLMVKGERVVINALRLSTNQVVSAIMVILIIIFLLLAMLFVFYKVHSESLYILQAVSLYVNTHIESSHSLINSSISSMGFMTNGLASAHSAGRSWIKTKVSTLPVGNSTLELEQTLLSLYDDMYEEWIQRNVTRSVGVKANVSITDLISTVKFDIVSRDYFSLNVVYANIAHLMKGTCQEEPDKSLYIANFLLCSKGMIVDVMNSLWMIVSSNMTLIIQVVMTFFTGVIEGGAAFLNFVVEFVVFITALYYLLVYSEEDYLPVKYLTSLLPHSGGERKEYSTAFVDATRGIFGASMKLSVFYGFYVWVTHTMFGLELAFMPALMAGLLSVVPVVGVYWASAPGVLVLWLVEGRTLRALSFFLLQVLPSYFIDMSIYSEIEGGWHPYITGLAVAGGVYYFGLEGAIIGPVVVCVLKTALNLYESVYKNLNYVEKTKIS